MIADAHKIPIDPILQWVSDINSIYPFVGTALALMAIDVIVGFIAAFKKKTLSSTISHIGMSKKAIQLLLIAVGRVLEPYTSGMPVGSMTASVFCVTELVSILENAAIAGVPIPQPILDALQKFKLFTGINHTEPAPPTSTTININKASNVDIHAQRDPENVNGAKAADSVIIGQSGNLHE